MTRKLFISLPMHGRSDEDVREEMNTLKRLFENDFNEKFELINTLEYQNPEESLKTPRLYYLGQAIMKLASADIAIFHPGWKTSLGCMAERSICVLYDIDTYVAHIDE